MNDVVISLTVLIAMLAGFLLVVRFLGPGVARFNRVATNPITRQMATRVPGFGIVIHTGRKSGRRYRTPLNVFKVPDGFVIALTYGRNSEWVRNVLAAGHCELETRGLAYHCSIPVVVHDPGRRCFPWPIRIALWIGGAADYLRVSASQVSRASA
jgi:deazaflavin-dependent oxidoreductase (nitroreductase family)